MPKFKKYIFNDETLSYYEVRKDRSARLRLIKSALLVSASFALALLYAYIYTSVLGFDLPKTALLKKTNAEWSSRIELMNRNLDRCERELSSIELRDNDIYRSIFGMNEISPEVRNAGYGGVNRYSYLDSDEAGALLKNTVIRLDVLTKKAYVQSLSFDEVESVAERAGVMASCIPAVPPVSPDRNTYRLSSSFGYRTDPFTGRTKRHTGMDFACKVGSPVYSTGDGVVESVRFDFLGYGHYVIIDHGFGYKTRYAHMKAVTVNEGMAVKRGEYIGESGNSGRSTGAHLHYEVIYRGNYVNPVNYMDLSMSADEYDVMTASVESASERIAVHSARK